MWQRIRLVAVRSVQEFLEDRCVQMSAAISYWALFSVFPLAILSVAVLGLVLRDEARRADLLSTLLDYVPLSDEGERELEMLLESVTSGKSTLGFLGLIGLVWTASGLMGAIRDAVNVAWDTRTRPPLRGKLLDIGMVIVVAVGVLASVGLTIAVRLAGEAGGELGGLLGAGASTAVKALALAIPVALTFATSAFLYRVLPAVHVTLGQIWPGALVSAVGFEAAKYAFAFYLQNFGRYNAIYGSIGAVIAVLFFVYIAANIFLLGAEVASEWPRAKRDLERGLPDEGPGEPLTTKIKRAARGLVFRQEEKEERPPGS